ncbi:DUF3891 family protein [Thalassobacillus hwangdonensis]|uniref:DUF3891 family protein n=1 Tax=Thalassobacillus hwangdonensis TaxID=546108 RepID=A0ABW3KZS0_9BACI
MIVNQAGDHFIMINQHDHARVSGEIVMNWKQDFLLRSKLREEADWAIGEHDRAWIQLDKKPLWNEEKERPYSFIDYPLEPKLDAYRQGLDEISETSAYAAILCSLHYSSFFPEGAKEPAIQTFLNDERNRREQLKNEMDMDIPSYLYDLHFKRLQFCDDLSLYVCMQEPGVSKANELSWFKDGFRQSFEFAPNGMIAHWEDEKTVSIDPFPLEKPFEIQIPYRKVTKQAIDEHGLQQAWDGAAVDYRKVRFERRRN